MASPWAWTLFGVCKVFFSHSDSREQRAPSLQSLDYYVVWADGGGAQRSLRPAIGWWWCQGKPGQLEARQGLTEHPPPRTHLVSLSLLFLPSPVYRSKKWIYFFIFCEGCQQLHRIILLLYTVNVWMIFLMIKSHFEYKNHLKCFLFSRLAFALRSFQQLFVPFSCKSG